MLTVTCILIDGDKETEIEVRNPQQFLRLPAEIDLTRTDKPLMRHINKTFEFSHTDSSGRLVYNRI